MNVLDRDWWEFVDYTYAVSVYQTIETYDLPNSTEEELGASLVQLDWIEAVGQLVDAELDPIADIPF